jgi:poly(A) polymerase
MLKLLGAELPVPVLRTMAATGILVELLPGALSFDRFQRLCTQDCDNFFEPDSVLRLGSLLTSPEQARETSVRWRLSNENRERLVAMSGSPLRIVSYLSIREVRRALYRLGRSQFCDLVRLKWADDAKASNGVQWRTLLALSEGWVRPQLALTGGDVMKAGVPHGPLVGHVLHEVEEWWIDADFTDDPFSIAERLKAVVQATI